MVPSGTDGVLVVCAVFYRRDRGSTNPVSPPLYPWPAVRRVGDDFPGVYSRLVGCGFMIGTKLYRIDAVAKDGGKRYLVLNTGRRLNALCPEAEGGRVMPSADFEECYHQVITSTMGVRRRPDHPPTARTRTQGMTRSREAVRARAHIPSRVPRPISEPADSSAGSEPALKADADEFAKLLSEHEVACLWHFTDAENVASIRQHGGLYSWYACQQRGIHIARPGGDDTSWGSDFHRRLEDYVRLSFNPNPPMLSRAQREGRIGNVEMIRVDPSVVLWRGTLFSDLNAVDSEARIAGDLAALQQIDLSVASSRYWDGEEQLRRRQAEVLVPTHIPLHLLSFDAN